MRLDHLSYAVSHSELADTVQRLGSTLGASFLDGGRHPRFGTQNFVLPLTNGTYVEVVAALDHPAAEKAPYGRAVRNKADDGGGWLGWVVAVDDITLIERRLGRASVDGQRVRPDGGVLTWKQIGINDRNDNPSLPSFTQWESPADEHPSTAAPAIVAATACEMCGDPDTIRKWLGEPIDSPFDSTRITWVTADEPGLISVTFQTPTGAQVRVD